MATRRIEHTAEKKKILTLAQVAAFVEDAMRSGATGDELVEVGMSFGGKLQKIGVTFEAGPAKRTFDISMLKDASPVDDARP